MSTKTERQFIKHFRWQFGGGYIYFCMLEKRYGWRQIGPEAFGIMDDFGFFVFVDRSDAVQE